MFWSPLISPGDDEGEKNSDEWENEKKSIDRRGQKGPLPAPKDDVPSRREGEDGDKCLGVPRETETDSGSRWGFVIGRLQSRFSERKEVDLIGLPGGS